MGTYISGPSISSERNSNSNFFDQEKYDELLREYDAELRRIFEAAGIVGIAGEDLRAGDEIEVRNGLVYRVRPMRVVNAFGLGRRMGKTRCFAEAVFAWVHEYLRRGGKNGESLRPKRIRDAEEGASSGEGEEG